MKFARVLVLAMALLMLSVGCSNRNEDGATSDDASGLLPEAGSAIGEGVGDLASGLEEGVEDLTSGLEDGMSRLEDGMYDDSSAMERHVDNGSTDPSELLSSEEDAFMDESMDESAAAAMSTDFSEIGALDATADSGFPGGPVDDKNRPSGPLGYQEKYGKYDAHFIVPDSEKIYLTFDEGYENGHTSRILDVLKEKNVKAVFFITYPYAESEPALVQRMIDEGHVLGNHSTAHKSFPTMPLQEAAEDIQKLHDYVKANFGYEMYLFRPPEGAFSEQTLALAQQLGYKTVLWSFAYKDWDTGSQPIHLEATETIVSKAHPGEIMLLHAVSQTNTEILGNVIDQLREQGFTFADYFYLEP